MNPEIYLHPDVQRQLVGILRQSGSDIVLASHSPEIIGEADPSEIVLIDKKRRAGERLKDIDAVQTVLDQIGSSQNITLTRLARNRRVLFVEDEYDFSVIRRFAHRLGFSELAAGADLTAVPSRVFSSWERVQALAWGIARTLGRELLIGVVYDRDYWCDEEISAISEKLRREIGFVYFHERKEIENYLLVPSVIARALGAAIAERKERGGPAEVAAPTLEEIKAILLKVTDPLLAQIQARYVSRRQEYLRKVHSKFDSAAVAEQTLKEIDQKWRDIDQRLKIVRGKEVVALFRQEIQSRFSVNLTDHRIISAFHADEIPIDLKKFIDRLNAFRDMKASEAV